MPGAIGIEVKPEGIELAEEAIVQEGDSPPAGGAGGNRLAIGPPQERRGGASLSTPRLLHNL